MSDAHPPASRRPSLLAGAALALLMAAGQAQPANLLINGDAETGDLTGWVDPQGNNFDVTDGTVVEGSFAFHAGAGGPQGNHSHEIYQDVDVSSRAAEIRSTRGRIVRATAFG